MPKSTGLQLTDIKEEIRTRTDILQLIGESVTLKRVGSRWVGLCPFHSDTQPSFYVNPERGAFKCFGCGVGGDIFDFVMEAQRLDFREAMQYLADRAGIEIPEKSGGSSIPKGYRDRLYEANEAALSFYREMLQHPQLGRTARQYLEKRGTDRSRQEVFELGYAPDKWDSLVSFFLKRGIALKDAEAVGLVVPREKGEGYYDRFRHRLMFPVRNATGKAVAFSGRLLEGEGAKYINSPESIIFKKNRTFFALNLAAKAIAKLDLALICEGNFDVVSLHQYGFDHSVAALGTAFTENHAALLQRYTKNPVFIFDGDEAGQKALVRVLEIYLQFDHLPKAVVLPNNEDPDSFLKAAGREKLAELIANSVTLLDFALERIFRGSGGGQEDLARSLDEACTLAGRIESPIRRGLLAKQLAVRVGLGEEAVRQQIDRSRRGSRAPQVAVSADGGQLPKSEQLILATLLHYPKLKGAVARDSILSALPEERMRKLAQRILDAPPEAERITAGSLIQPDDDEELKSLAGELLLADPPCEDRVAEKMLLEAVRDREKRKLNEEMDAVRTELNEARQADDQPRIDQLTSRLFALRKELEMIRL